MEHAATCEQKKLGWQTELKEVRLELCEIGDRIPAKATAACPLLTAGGELMAEGVPGPEVLRGEFPGGEDPQSRGSCGNETDRPAEHESG